MRAGFDSQAVTDRASATWVSIDTQDRTWHAPPMVTRIKRTYNLAPATVRRVRELAEEYAVAPSQDAVIELAIDELDRRLRDAREGDAWAAAATDPAFTAESAELEAAYGSADAETWLR